MADVLAFTIELPDGKYASINNRSRGFRDPRKSPIYNAVFAAVKKHAEDEIDRIGWTKAECECAVTIIRVVNRRMRVDAGNLSKVELDSMTEAGVWTDDRLATPVNLMVRYDADGVNRVIIVVTKLHDPLNVRIVEKPPKPDKLTKPVETVDNPTSISASKKTPGPQRYTGGDIPAGMAIVNGFLVPYEDALSMINKRSA